MELPNRRERSERFQSYVSVRLSTSRNGYSAMAFQEVSSCAELVLKFTDESGAFKAGNNVLTFRKTDATSFDASDVEALSEAAPVAFGTSGLVPLISTEVKLASVVARDLESSTPFVYDNAVDIDGTLSSSALPYNVTIAINKRTGAAGRTRRGRLYHVGLGENQVSGNHVLPTPAAAILTAWAQFFVDMESEGFVHVLVSRYLNGVKRASGVKYNVTELQLTDTRVDTMRRRLNTD